RERRGRFFCRCRRNRLGMLFIPCPERAMSSIIRLAVVSSVFLFSICGASAQTLEPRPLFVEAYTSQLSYAPGEEVSLCVSTSATKYALEIARQGAKRDVVLTK